MRTNLPQVDPRYTPPPIPGFVMWSNYSRDNFDYKSNKNLGPYTREDIIVSISTELDLPIEDIMVVDFMPDGEPTTPTGTRWAAFIRDKHAHLVAVRDERLLALFQLCDMLIDPFREDTH